MPRRATTPASQKRPEGRTDGHSGQASRNAAGHEKSPGAAVAVPGLVVWDGARGLAPGGFLCLSGSFHSFDNNPFCAFCSFWEFQHISSGKPFCDSIGIFKILLFKCFCVLLLSQGVSVRSENHFLLVFQAVIVLLPEYASNGVDLAVLHESFSVHGTNLLHFFYKVGAGRVPQIPISPFPCCTLIYTYRSIRRLIAYLHIPLGAEFQITGKTPLHFLHVIMVKGFSRKDNLHEPNLSGIIPFWQVRVLLHRQRVIRSGLSGFQVFRSGCSCHSPSPPFCPSGASAPSGLSSGQLLSAPCDTVQHNFPLSFPPFCEEGRVKSNFTITSS
nr:MAG TPA: hypothetical protein [Caudoviricetes sp.]